MLNLQKIYIIVYLLYLMKVLIVGAYGQVGQ
jgi:hypothetical protein